MLLKNDIKKNMNIKQIIYVIKCSVFTQKVIKRLKILTNNNRTINIFNKLNTIHFSITL